MSLSDFRSAKLTYLFRLMDKDGDGMLSQSDFDDIARRASENQGISKEEKLNKRLITDSAKRYYRRLLSELDMEEGKISLQNWLNYFHKLQDDDPIEYDSLIQFFMEFFFGVFDFNKDGFITMYEAMELYQILGLPIQDSKAVFRQLDLNADGHISRYELMDSIEIFLMSDDEQEKGNWIFGDWNLGATSSSTGNI